MRLHHFFRSGTSHRLRIALNLKELAYETVVVDLRTEAHMTAVFRTLNPQGLVPVLEHQGEALIQSPAILEWLEERYPLPPLLPPDMEGRARVRAMAAIVGCDIHPLNNRRVLEALRQDFSADEPAIHAWCARWIGSGFDALEAIACRHAHRGRFCYGDGPGMADVYLAAQAESARRFRIDMTRWPRLSAIDAACAQIDAFRRAAPAMHESSNP